MNVILDLSTAMQGELLHLLLQLLRQMVTPNDEICGLTVHNVHPQVTRGSRSSILDH